MNLTLITCLIADAPGVNEIARLMQLAAGGGDGGQNSLKNPIYAVGATDDSAPVRFWAAINFQPEFRAQAQADLAQYPNCTIDDYDPIADPGFPDQKLAEWGLRRAFPKLP